MWNASRFCVSSLRRGHANLLCIVPIIVPIIVPDDTGSNKELPKSKTMPAVEKADLLQDNDIENPTEYYKDQTKKYQDFMETFEDETKNGHDPSSTFLETSDPMKPDRKDINEESEHCPDIITIYEGFPETKKKKTYENNEEKSNNIFSLDLSNRSDPTKFIGNNFFEDTEDSQVRTNIDKYYPKNPIEPITEIMDKETCNTNKKYSLETKISFGGQDYKCELCDYRSSYKPHIKSHQYFVHKIVSNESLFPCGKCDKILISDLKLKKHNNLHHNPDAYKCDTCGKILSNQVSLKSHKLVKHSKDKHYFCDICKTGFVSDKILKIHIEGVHEKKYQFACPYCETKLSHRSKFTRHSRIFHEGKQLLT